MAVEIEIRGTEIHDQFVALLRETFDAEAVRRKVECWDWLFHPAVGPDAPPVQVLTAWRDGRFVGGSIMGVSAYLWRGQRRYFLSPYGTNIDPKVRGLGINLVKEFYKRTGHMIGIPISEQFARVNEKFGARRAERVQMFAPLRAGRALARRKPAAALLAGPGDALWSAWRKVSGLRGARLGRGETITEATTFGAEHDAFWARAAAHHRFIQIRNSAYMKWRFQDMPLQKYHVLHLRRGGAVQGFVAVGEAIDPERGTGQVTDILTVDDNPRDLALLLRAASQRLYALGAEVAAFGCVRRDALMQAAELSGFTRSKPTRPAQLFYSDPESMVEIDADLAELYLTRADQDEDY